MTVNSGGKQILLHGMSLVFVGLLCGFVPPLAPFPRLALGAHIQFESNGTLLLILALLLLKLPHHVGSKSITVMIITAWLTWLMAFSEVANAWWGTNQMLPISAAQAAAFGGAPWQELTIKLTHMLAGLGLILSWSLLMAGFLRKGDTEEAARPRP